MSHDPNEEVPITITAFEIVDGVEVPIGKPRETTISCGALDLMHGTGALNDRRQRAREAGQDARSGQWSTTQAIEQAIETATRVRIDREIEWAARGAFEDHYGGSVRPIIVAAFRAAGFEVEE
jgi:hypothetical protein